MAPVEPGLAPWSYSPLRSQAHLRYPHARTGREP